MSIDETPKGLAFMNSMMAGPFDAPIMP